MDSSPSLHIVPQVQRWSSERVLEDARRRTKQLCTDNPKRVQEMLGHLMNEAGWDEDDFITALCQDAIQRGTH